MEQQVSTFCSRIKKEKVIQVLNLWSSLGGLVSAGQLGVQGEDGQEEGGDEVGQVPQEEDYARRSSESFLHTKE